MSGECEHPTGFLTVSATHLHIKLLPTVLLTATQMPLSPSFPSAGGSRFFLRAFFLPFYRVVLLNPVLIAHPCTLTTSHQPEGETGEVTSQLYPALTSTSFIHKGLSTTDQLK